MSKLSAEELRQIVARQLPGHRIVERSRGQDAAAQAAESDAVTPDLETLRRKYFGDAAETVGTSRAASIAGDSFAASVAEGAIVQVLPDADRDNAERGPGPKGVVISGSERKIVGQQG